MTVRPRRVSPGRLDTPLLRSTDPHPVTEIWGSGATCSPNPREWSAEDATPRWASIWAGRGRTGRWERPLDGHEESTRTGRHVLLEAADLSRDDEPRRVIYARVWLKHDTDLVERARHAASCSPSRTSSTPLRGLARSHESGPPDGREVGRSVLWRQRARR